MKETSQSPTIYSMIRWDASASKEHFALEHAFLSKDPSKRKTIGSGTHASCKACNLC